MTTEFFKNVEKNVVNRNSWRIPLSSAFFSKPSWKINFLERVSAAFLTRLLTEIPSRILAELMTSAFPSRILTGKVCYFSTFMLWILTTKAGGIRILLDWNTSEQKIQRYSDRKSIQLYFLPWMTLIAITYVISLRASNGRNKEELDITNIPNRRVGFPPNLSDRNPPMICVQM